MDQVKKKWMSNRTYGGRLVENLVQAIARDRLAETMVRTTDAGYPMALHVHDEICADVLEGFGFVDKMTEIMSQPIDWAPGLPLAVAEFEY